jgi:hypothetical protein
MTIDAVQGNVGMPPLVVSVIGGVDTVDGGTGWVQGGVPAAEVAKLLPSTGAVGTGYVVVKTGKVVVTVNATFVSVVALFVT